MTAVANPPSFSQITRPAWGANSPAALNDMNSDDVAKMFMPRKSVQRSNSSSSISSVSSTSSTGTVVQAAPTTNGVSMSPMGEVAWNAIPAKRKVTLRSAGTASKTDGMGGSTLAGPRSVLAHGSGPSSALSSISPSPLVASQHLGQNGTQQMNGTRGMSVGGEGNPVLYLLSLNGTFERKRIVIPFYPDAVRIGRQTNAKTAPTAVNGFFDSKVLSRQHAEIWAERNGKIWIRDVKSSNGTFVNSVRLSAENKDSDPHELQTQDQLELGIDIVSEDQKSVVHHKVAAKVEHAGFMGSSNNVMDMNFGDLDPANGSLMSNHAGIAAVRGRSGSQGSSGSSVRAASSLAGSQMSIIPGQRPMNYWLTPVTTEQIAKRIQHEMRSARVQAKDLNHAETFFGSLLSNKNVKDDERASFVSRPHMNNVPLPFRTNRQTRFSDPPAPPPQQPLPEKPDGHRSFGYDASSAGSRRSSSDRPQSVPSIPAMKTDPSSQIVSLVEALATARRDIEAQSAKMRDLEDMLAHERQAREAAEQVARSLESKSVATKNTFDDNCNPKHRHDTASGKTSDESSTDTVDNQQSNDAGAIAESTKAMEQRIEALLSEMRDLKQQSESFRNRAETAEIERDSGRRTLAQMVERIRMHDTQKSTSTDHGSIEELLHGGSEAMSTVLAPLSRKEGAINGSAHSKSLQSKSNSTRGSLGTDTSSGTVSQQHAPLAYQSAPYASMIGVVLIGMGLMAYINGWQPPKVER